MIIDSINTSSELQSRLISTMDWIGEIASNSKQFIYTEAPLLAQEYIRYILWSNAISAVIYSVSFIILMVFFYKMIRVVKKAMKEHEDVAVFFGMLALVGSGMMGFFCLVTTIKNVDVALKAAIAPRVVVVEEFSKFMNRLK